MHSSPRLRAPLPEPETACPPPVHFLGGKLHLVSMAQSVTQAMQAMRSGRCLHQVSLNVAKLVTLRRNSELAADVMGADLVCADGMGIVLGARLLGIAVPERVAGVDLMENVLVRCAAEGFRPYFLGARPDVLLLAMARVKARYPALCLAGSQDGYYTSLQEAAVVRKIRASRPDCLFVGMPTPRKESFLARHHAALQIPYVMGVGGGIDILAGHVRRAPVLWQKMGLEWLYRVVQEPRRMWRRYLTTNAAFAWIVAKALVQSVCHVGNPHAQRARGGDLAMSLLAVGEAGCVTTPDDREAGDTGRHTGAAASAIIGREIGADDFDDVATLLHEGFPSQTADRFLHALRVLAEREEVPGLPRFGHVLQAGSACVGVLLTIPARITDEADSILRCNPSCWYVRPPFRLYASMLVLRAMRGPAATYINTSAAGHTWRTIRSQGFLPVSAGTFASMPALSIRSGMARITRVSPTTPDVDGVSKDTMRMLREHAAFGCESLVCHAHAPVAFVFRRRRFDRFPLPGAQLIYCRDMHDLARFAGPVGRYLALRGMPWLLAGTNGRIPGIVGRYFTDKMPIYGKGLPPPAVGDLRYTETAMFGF